MSNAQHSHFIRNEFRAAHSPARITVIDPSTEEEIGSIADGDAADVDAAVRAAQEALPSWAALEPRARGDVLRALADAFEERSEDISQLVTRQNGTPISITRAMQSQVPVQYRYFASLADALEVETHVTTASGDAIVRQDPVGVAAAITPWNGPQPLAAWKLGPALAAGCTAVLKPAAETSLDSFLLAEVIRAAGLPSGVINIVTGGRETGSALVAHPGVRKVGFTGSPAAGRAIATEAAKTFKRITLELGGKSAAILLEDVDLEAFRPFVHSGCTPNTGQTCRAFTRILAPRSRYEEITEFLAATVDSLPLGDPKDPQTLYGPLVNAAQRERVESYIRLGLDEGAELVTGGGRPAGFEKGYYVEPTVFRSVTNDMRIAREEIFGPVIVVMPYDTVDEAVEIANDSEYGLSGGVFSPDVERATDIARRFETGSVAVNASALPIETPFGGTKLSGVGRELGPDSLAPYLESKTIFRTPAS
jgi:aldehyde dehydrogenase (NAD+)